jgi:Ras-related protein Rab-1A
MLESFEKQERKEREGELLMNSKSSKEEVLKIVLIGDAGVGKSCILLRFVEDSFPESYVSTIGVDFMFKRIVLDSNAESTKLQVWDTAGQERYRSITSAYYRGADAIVMVYDVTSKQSFEHIESWVQEIVQYHDSTGESPVVVLVGNKVDVTGPQRKISADDAKELADKLNLLHFETSAKNNDNNVEDMFKTVAKLTLEQKKKTKQEHDLIARQAALELEKQLEIEKNQAKHSVCCSIL